MLPVVRLEFYTEENNLFISTNLLNKTLTILKNHFKY